MRAHAARATPEPIFAARAETFRDVALWSLRGLLFTLVVAAFALSRPAAPQLALSIELGRRVAMEHAFGLGWLGALEAWAVSTASGLGGLAAVAGIATVATLALVEFRARRRGGAILALGATILAAATFFDALHVGGGAPRWLGAAAFLLALERRRGAWLALPIALVWCNFSATGLLAPILAALVALGRTIDLGPRAPMAVRAWAIAIGSAIVATLTPDGIAYFGHAWSALHFDRRVIGLIPILPSEVAPQGYRFGLTAVVVLAAWLWNYRRRADDVLLTLAGVILVFLDGTNLPLLGIIAGPAFAGSLRRLWPNFGADPPPARERWAAAGVALVAFVIAAGFALAPNERLLRQSPEAGAEQTAIGQLAGDGRRHVLYCSVALWCDYAAPFHNIDVVLDERFERVKPEVWIMATQISHVRLGWRKALSGAGVDAVVARRKGALATLLSMDRGWESRASDPTFMLFVRRHGSVR